MSTSRETTVWCEGDNCSVFEQVSGNVRDARAEVKDRGWRYVGGRRDLCPCCAGTCRDPYCTTPSCMERQGVR